MDTPRDAVCVSLALTLVLFLIVLSGIVNAKSIYVIGDKEHPWDEDGAVLEGIEVTSHPGWIMPRQIAPDENLVKRWLLPGWELWISAILDPDKAEAWERFWEQWREYDVGWLRPRTIIADLGTSYGIHRVRGHLYTVEETENGEPVLTDPKHSWYEVGINDGESDAVNAFGNPVLRSVIRKEEGFPDVEVAFPTQKARYVGITGVLRRDWMHYGYRVEVYGEGFVPHSTYVSRIMDLRALTDVGRIRWKGERDPDAQILIHTRTGMDPDPEVYWRMGEKGEKTRFDASGEELTKETYDQLPEAQRGGITYDTEHWSFWSAPYPFEDGEKGRYVVSPSPCQYLQIKVEMKGEYNAYRALDHLTVEYAQPPVAHGVMGEVYPTEVTFSQRVTFHYAVSADLQGEDRGFDRMRILTPIPVDTVWSVLRNEEEVDCKIERLDDPIGFVMHFPRVRIAGMPLEVWFDTSVFRYGTAFEGWVFDSREEEVPQKVVPGDATPLLDSSSLSVKTSLDASLIGAVQVIPNPFTPNGDGFNDHAEIAYDLLQLTRKTAVTVEIFDLSGRWIRNIYVGDDAAGRYVRRWDGTDGGGQGVPPGIYFCRISVQMDVGQESIVRTVGVVY